MCFYKCDIVGAKLNTQNKHIISFVLSVDYNILA